MSVRHLSQGWMLRRRNRSLSIPLIVLVFLRQPRSNFRDLFLPVSRHADVRAYHSTVHERYGEADPQPVNAEGPRERKPDTKRNS